MCHLQGKYWKLPGHLSGNVWAIWKITFCKWTQIKMYVLPFHCAGFISASTHKYYRDIMFPVLGSARCAVYLLHGFGAHGLLVSDTQRGAFIGTCCHFPGHSLNILDITRAKWVRYLPIVFLKPIPKTLKAISLHPRVEGIRSAGSTAETMSLAIQLKPKIFTKASLCHIAEHLCELVMQLNRDKRFCSAGVRKQSEQQRGLCGEN